jgi:fatty-acyl-CoA synthase
LRQPRATQRTLIERLDGLAEAHERDIAQTYIASGDPDDEPCNLTFSEFVNETRRRANALCALDVRSNDVIAFASPLSEGCYPMMAATMVTATYAPVNYFLEAEALIRIVRASGAKILLFNRRFDDGLEIVGKLRRVLEALPHVLPVSFGTSEQIDGVLDLDTAAVRQPSAYWTSQAPGQAADRVIALFHTGGTTGLPKLVPHTEAMYDAMIEQCGAAQGTWPGETIISGLPLFHTSGALQAGLVPLMNGARIVIPSSRGFRDPGVIANYWRFVRRFGINIGAGVPTVLAALCSVEPPGPITSLKRFLVGGAPIAKATIAKISEMTSGAEVVEGWGMTETCGFSVLNPHGKAKVGSVGLPFPGVELEIRQFGGHAAKGRRCDVDTIGEVVVRGDIVIKSYLDDRPNAFTADGWLRTGDLGRVDSDGYLWIAGRVKDVIIRGGHNIDPATIEEPAYQHPAVHLAAAVGKPDRYAGELPIVYVQLKPGARASQQDLADFLRERIVERAAVPKSVVIVPEIPLSGVGKILKLPLRRKAISAAFQEEINRLSLERLQIHAAVADDPVSGEVVVLGASGGKPNSGELGQVAAALAGFSIPYRWADAADIIPTGER